MGKLAEHKDHSITRRRMWFDAFLYIFNKHWDKIDNFRIDKYLMFLRHMFNETLAFLKSVAYSADELEWFYNKIVNLCTQPSGVNGMALQICDVLVPELNKVDKEISLDNITKILEPFLRTYANS